MGFHILELAEVLRELPAEVHRHLVAAAFRNVRRDFVLGAKSVRERALVNLGEHLATIARSDELQGNADLAFEFLNRSLEDVVDAKVFRQRFDLEPLSVCSFGAGA